MTWKEFKEIVDREIKKHGLTEENVEISYIDTMCELNSLEIKFGDYYKPEKNNKLMSIT